MYSITDIARIVNIRQRKFYNKMGKERGNEGDVTFFSEESNKEPVLWTGKLLVLSWKAALPPTCRPPWQVKA